MFIEYGLNSQNPIPVEKLFKRLVVSKTSKLSASRRAMHRLTPDDEPTPDHNAKHANSASDAYHMIEDLKQKELVIHAKQLMTSPVVYIENNLTIAEVFKYFKKHTYRHMPILTPQGQLTGIVSDRDILRYVGDCFDKSTKQIVSITSQSVTTVMSSPVLTASIDTDVRYIAQLFVRQHIGSIPIMSDGILQGIITRTDMMSAVMKNYDFELWI